MIKASRIRIGSSGEHCGQKGFVAQSAHWAMNAVHQTQAKPAIAQAGRSDFGYQSLKETACE